VQRAAWFGLGALPQELISFCRVALAHIAAGVPFSVHGW
jgi:8-oxo-dGTP diphosphatase